MIDALRKFGAVALGRAERWFARDIYDPKHTDKTPHGIDSLAAISEITRANNWGTYPGNDVPVNGAIVQWCGMFLFECWAEAGLDRVWLAHFGQSTGRIRLWATYQPFNQYKNAPLPAALEDRRLYIDLRKHPETEIVPGMGVIIGDYPANPKADPHGRHVTMAVSRVGNVIHTISGNGGGLGPDGKRREGVVRADYTIGTGTNTPMFAVYPGFGDLLAERP